MACACQGLAASLTPVSALQEHSRLHVSATQAGNRHLPAPAGMALLRSVESRPALLLPFQRGSHQSLGKPPYLELTPNPLCAAPLETRAEPHQKQPTGCDQATPSPPGAIPPGPPLWRRQAVLLGTSAILLSLAPAASPFPSTPAAAAEALDAAAPEAEAPSPSPAPATVKRKRRAVDEDRGPAVLRRFRTPGGVIVEELVEGAGDSAAELGDLVTFHYVCRRSNGYFVASTIDPLGKAVEPLVLPLGPKGQMIQGLTEVMQGMKPGGKRRALVPPEVGYVSRDLQPLPEEYDRQRALFAHSAEPLVFEVRLLSIRHP